MPPKPYCPDSIPDMKFLKGEYMYSVNDRPAAIKEVQKYLSSYSEGLTFIPQSGVYDKVTKDAVIGFQIKFNIVPTGIVDYLTFTLLYDNYRMTQTKKDVRETVDSVIKFPLILGTESTEMRQINQIIGALLDYYGITHSLTESIFFTEETLRGVLSLEKIYAIQKDGIIDEEFYRRIYLDYDSIVSFTNGGI